MAGKAKSLVGQTPLFRDAASANANGLQYVIDFTSTIWLYLYANSSTNQKNQRVSTTAWMPKLASCAGCVPPGTASWCYLSPMLFPSISFQLPPRSLQNLPGSSESSRGTKRQKEMVAVDRKRASSWSCRPARVWGTASAQFGRTGYL